MKGSEAETVQDREIWEYVIRLQASSTRCNGGGKRQQDGWSYENEISLLLTRVCGRPCTAHWSGHIWNVRCSIGHFTRKTPSNWRKKRDA